jgi:hypothetical protein
MNSRTKKEDCIIIHTYNNIKESEDTIHTSFEYICLSPLMFLLATFPKVAKIKREKSFEPNQKNSFPISPKSQDQWDTQQERHTKERYSQRETETEIQREREIKEFPPQNWLLLSCKKAKS